MAFTKQADVPKQNIEVVPAKEAEAQEEMRRQAATLRVSSLQDNKE